MEILSVAIVAFTFGWIIGSESRRKFDRRMRDIERRKRNIAWPIGHKEV